VTPAPVPTSVPKAVSGQQATPFSAEPYPAHTPVDSAILSFLEAFRILSRSARLYQRTHPRWVENLQETERRMRDALTLLPRIIIGVERGALVAPHPESPRGRPLADPQGDWKALADELSRAGLSSITFLSQAHMGEIELLAQKIAGAARARHASPEAAAADWQAWIETARISGIRVNVPIEPQDATVLAVFVSALLAYEDPESPHSTHDSRSFPPMSRDQAIATMRLLAKLGTLEELSLPSAEEAARHLHAELAEATPTAIAVAARALSIHPPRPADTLHGYVHRLIDLLLLEFARREFLRGGIQAPEIVALLAGLERERLAKGDLAQAPDVAEQRVAALVDRFWENLPARERTRVLRSHYAWCVPASALARHIEPMMLNAERRHNETPAREARAILLRYASGLESEEARARRAVAAGLAEIEPQIVRLWPHSSAENFGRDVARALVLETSPGISGLLVALAGHLMRLALAGRQYAEFERILVALDAAPRDAEHAHISAMVSRVTADESWLYLVEDALATRPLDPVLPRLLRRDPLRLLDRLALLLTAPEGLDALPAMARLVRAAGEPVLGALQSRLFEPRRQPAATAIKLLAAVEPARLIACLPRALPSWDWNLQDLAVTELSRLTDPELILETAGAFREVVAEAHSLAVPSMLDQIGLAQDTRALPLLTEIASGTHETLRDVFFRIKAVEALGRIRAPESADLLRLIVRERAGLTHAEPAGLRSAAQESLALIENHPAAARVRAQQEALNKSGLSFARPRRYVRIPLVSTYSARLEGLRSGACKVRTLSLGGAYLEANQRLAVGDSLRVEFRAGLHKIQSTAVVRNVSPGGGGIEFVHMKAADRERLRRLIGRLSR